MSGMRLPLHAHGRARTTKVAKHTKSRAAAIARATLTVGFIAVGLTGAARWARAAEQSPPLANVPESGTMQIVVLGPDEKPLAKAKVHVAVWTKEPFQRNRDYVCDADGRTTIELPGKLEILRIWASYEGHVGLFAQWWPAFQTDGALIPDEFTFELEKGSVIGGVVKNDDGQPIAGVKVQAMLVHPAGEESRFRPYPNTWLAEGDGARVTDANGRWALDNVPSADKFDVRVLLNHADYISDYSWGGLQREQNVGLEELRDRTATIVMHRGISVTGTVTANGKPVPDAVVVWGENPYEQQGSQEVRTDKGGRYRFPPLLAGPLTVTVIAEGWAPDQEKTEIAAEDSEVDFQLQRGKPLRIRFVDEAGKPVPGVGVGLHVWRRNQALYNHIHPNVLPTKIPTQAGKDGVYEWAWAPDGPISFGFYKEGFGNQPERTLTAGEKEHVITIR